MITYTETYHSSERRLRTGKDRLQPEGRPPGLQAADQPPECRLFADARSPAVATSAQCRGCWSLTEVGFSAPRALSDKLLMCVLEHVLAASCTVERVELPAP